MSTEERELKLAPRDSALLEELAALRSIGPFKVVGEKLERQRNAYFDTRSRALHRAKLAFRRRVERGHGQALATWTLKAEGSVLAAIATRPEIELRLAADMAPALAIVALGDAARSRGAAPLAEQLADALVDGLPLAEPFIEMDNDRRIRDLRTDDGAWSVELALDQVRLVGAPGYLDEEIEVELRTGGDEALEAARRALEALGEVREADGHKLTRALDYLARSASSSR